jgi:glycosyltransferase involved in cell wall biosynthesis
MLHDRGHIVYHYGHKDSEVECTEIVHITDNEVLKQAYGEYDWKKNFFKHNNGDHAHQTFYQRSIVEVAKRKKPGDFLLCFWGQRPVADAHPDLICVEPGIGCFNKLFAPFNVFESYAVMNVIYGIMDNKMPAWYDCVIPNYFDPADFEYRETKGDYFLFLGRLIRNKGLPIAVDIAKKTGTKLIVAGQGDYKEVMGEDPPECVEVVGYADWAKRRELLAGAKALIQASYYSEPFGGSVVEAYFSGTPVITSDWGVFPETVVHGVTGYRCRTMDHFIWAAKNIDKLSNKACYDWAMANYSCDRIALMYEEYFKMLSDVSTAKGFYEIHEDRTELDWLKKTIPGPQ